MTGMIEDTPGLIENDTGMITETNDVEDNPNGRRKRSRERAEIPNLETIHFIQ